MLGTNQKWWVVGIFALLVLSAFLVRPVSGQTEDRGQVQTTPTPGVFNRTISVNGTGSAEVEPDLAIINLGVQTDADTASEALTQNNQQMEAVLNTLRTAGIANNDIRTTIIQIYPRYEVPPQPREGQTGQPELIGYTATNTVEVRVRNINNLGTILDQVVSSGGNRVDSIRFDVSDQAGALEQAREAAMQNAADKAEQLAGLANGQLGPVVTIVENSRGPIFFEAAAMDQAAGGSAVPIAPGTQSITVDLQVTWELQ